MQAIIGLMFILPKGLSPREILRKRNTCGEKWLSNERSGRSTDVGGATADTSTAFFKARVSSSLSAWLSLSVTEWEIEQNMSIARVVRRVCQLFKQA